MTARLLIVSASLFLPALPCLAGPCTKDIESMRIRIEDRLNATAAAGPTAKQSTGAQMHRQPTPGSIANAERKLGELSPGTIVTVKEAMDRAQKADAAGDDSGCRKILEQIARSIGREPH
jgi:hypothetical protein